MSPTTMQSKKSSDHFFVDDREGFKSVAHAAKFGGSFRNHRGRGSNAVPADYETASPHP